MLTEPFAKKISRENLAGLSRGGNSSRQPPPPTGIQPASRKRLERLSVRLLAIVRFMRRLVNRHD
jgi:hypothetical protein